MIGPDPATAVSRCSRNPDCRFELALHRRSQLRLPGSLNWDGTCVRSGRVSTGGWRSWFRIQAADSGDALVRNQHMAQLSAIGYKAYGGTIMARTDGPHSRHKTRPL
jgi:hypothetical protein